MDYQKTHLKEVINIRYIYTVHYFEYSKDYVFEGEEHDFWEFLYVDKGEVDVLAGERKIRLEQGEMIFHKPAEFHNVWSTGETAPNLVVISFECKSPAMKRFENTLLSVDNYCKNLLALIIKESVSAFNSPLNTPELKKLERRNDSAVFGCEQLIITYLTQLLIYLIRKSLSTRSESRISSAMKENADGDMADSVIEYLDRNVKRKIRFRDVLDYSKLSATNLKVLFKEKTGVGVMEYFRKLKIDEAKRLIREEKYNFSEIANMLGYESIHYFSRQFKSITGMNPTEYAISVKARI
ncbi:MAG: AraC family transcriptional regulator [Eubacteriales bacterium]|nr:AraC family transcriptional regulator [Eubacteriales bacterium]